MKICLSCGCGFMSHDWECPECRKTPLSREGLRSFLDEKEPSCEFFNPEYYPRLYRLEMGSFWFRHRSRLILKTMETYFPSAAHVLEIGCGTGFVLSEIRKKHPRMTLSGSDLFSEGLRFARTRIPDASFYRMDACRMPFDREFDLILALDVLEHVEDDSRAIGEIFRSLKPGGGAVVTVPQHPWLWTIQDEKAFHRRRYTRQELTAKMAGKGFRIVSVTSFITLLLPVLIISRIFAGFALNGRKREYDPLRELKLNPVINAVMDAVCKGEEYILRHGAHLPAGGSLLCVGIKEQ